MGTRAPYREIKIPVGSLVQKPKNQDLKHRGYHPGLLVQSQLDDAFVASSLDSSFPRGRYPGGGRR